jgi:RNA polymerase sigma factor (sigma-70 family)
MALLLAGARDYHLAEDLFQEVWVRLAQCLEAGANISDEARWCRATAKHLLLHHWRSERRTVVGACADFEAVLERLERSLMESEAFAGEAFTRRQEALLECLAHLPPRQRGLLELKYELRCSIDQISQKLCETPAAISKALTRLRHGLQMCVRKRLQLAEALQR